MLVLCSPARTPRSPSRCVISKSSPACSSTTARWHGPTGWSLRHGRCIRRWTRQGCYPKRRRRDGTPEIVAKHSWLLPTFELVNTSNDFDPPATTTNRVSARAALRSAGGPTSCESWRRGFRHEAVAHFVQMRVFCYSAIPGRPPLHLRSLQCPPHQNRWPCASMKTRRDTSRRTPKRHTGDGDDARADFPAQNLPPRY